MGEVLFVMAIIVAVGKFFDFLIGRKGDRLVKGQAC
jgi:hypothetical protein